MLRHFLNQENIQNTEHNYEKRRTKLQIVDEAKKKKKKKNKDKNEVEETRTKFLILT